jgi:hypothetical protein
MLTVVPFVSARGPATKPAQGQSGKEAPADPFAPSAGAAPVQPASPAKKPSSQEDPFSDPGPSPNSPQPQQPAPPPTPPAAKPSDAGKVPPLEEFLERAMAGHPEIEAARAKVALAESELRQVQFRVARELVNFHTDWAFQTSRMEYLKEEFRTGKVTQTDMIEDQAKLAELEAQTRTLLSRKPSAASVPCTSASSAKLKPPRGPIVEKMRQVLNKQMEVDFTDLPLQDTMTYIEDLHGISMMVVIDPQYKGSLQPDQPINVSLKEAPLGAVLQAIEDATGNVRFVLRDYAIVAVPNDSPLATSAVSAVEFWEQSLPEGAKPEGEKK